MKTSTRHFEIFKKECAKWIDFFGLKDWDILYAHNDSRPDSCANVTYNLSAKNVVIRLTKTWGEQPITVKRIKRSAFHEVCEVMIARLVICSAARFLNKDEIEEASHDIIRRLENSVFEA